MDTSDKETPFRPNLRSTPRAFILRRGQLLVQEKLHPEKGRYFTLPGGKQETGEPLTEALQRECLEEIGVRVTVLQLLHVAEVFRSKPATGDRLHQLDFVFECSVPDTYEPSVGPAPDPHQIATRWLAAENGQQLRPAYVTKLFSNVGRRGHDVYLGQQDE